MKNKTNFKYISISDLEFDFYSSRLPSQLQGTSEIKAINYYILDESTLELMQAIGENGFFEGEQLLVVKLSENKYKVIEGNRRLTSVKLLNDYTLATVKKDSVKKVYNEAITKLPIEEIPCLVFEKEEEIRKHLGFRHVTGIKAWGLSEKARYLSELHQSNFSHLPFSKACYELAKTIGSTKSYITRVLTAYGIYKYIEDEAFFDIKDLDDTNFFVGYYSDGIGRANIAKFLGIDLHSEDPVKGMNKENVKSLTKWFYEKFELDGKIQTRLKGKSGDLNNLNTILGHDNAMKAFVEQGYTLEKASTLAEDIEQIFYNSLRSALLNLENADRITQNLKNFYSGIEDDLVQIRKLTSKIKSAKENLEEGDW